MNKKLIIVFIVALLALVICAKLGFSWYLGATKNNDAFFESAIVAFEELDKVAFPKADGIVFVGSSSIRFWNSLTEDMAPLPVIQRGFGGAHMSHVLYNFDRIITPYKPRAVVVFVGGNDIGSGKSAKRLVSDYEKFIQQLNNKLPQADLWILGMKPSKLRWELWGEMQQVDVALKAFAEDSQKIFFVKSGDVLLGVDGKPDDVYILDGLHLNDEGYRRWNTVLKPMLLEKYSNEI